MSVRRPDAPRVLRSPISRRAARSHAAPRLRTVEGEIPPRDPWARSRSRHITSPLPSTVPSSRRTVANGRTAASPRGGVHHFRRFTLSRDPRPFRFFFSQRHADNAATTMRDRKNKKTSGEGGGVRRIVEIGGGLLGIGSTRSTIQGAVARGRSRGCGTMMVVVAQNAKAERRGGPTRRGRANERTGPSCAYILRPLSSDTPLHTPGRRARRDATRRGEGRGSFETAMLPRRG